MAVLAAARCGQRATRGEVVHELSDATNRCFILVEAKGAHGRRIRFARSAAAVVRIGATERASSNEQTRAAALRTVRAARIHALATGCTARWFATRVRRARGAGLCAGSTATRKRSAVACRPTNRGLRAIAAVARGTCTAAVARRAATSNDADCVCKRDQRERDGRANSMRHGFAFGLTRRLRVRESLGREALPTRRLSNHLLRREGNARSALAPSAFATQV